MNTTPIIWTKDDKQALRRAVTNFNKKVKRLQKLEDKDLKGILPDLVDYKELVGISKPETWKESIQILNRRELGNIIRSLKRFTKRGAEEKVTLAGGEEVTKWERNEIRLMKNRATRSLNRDIENLEAEQKVNFGMGDEVIQAKKGTLRALKNINALKGYAFKERLASLKRNARADTNLKKGKIWLENFKAAVEGLEGYKGKDRLLKLINETKNPIDLYEKIKDIDELKDIFLYYHDSPASNTYSGFDKNQDAIISGLEKLGLK